MKILVMNGPNLNFLGIREPDIYGKKTYDDLTEMISAHAKGLGVEVEFYQSNHEGDLIDKIQDAYFSGINGIVFNPGGYTHTSVAIADAVKSVAIPTVEVHISDVDSREAFRHISYVEKCAVKTIKGHGFDGYNEAVDFLLENYGGKK